MLGSYFKSVFTEEGTNNLDQVKCHLRSERASESLDTVTFTPTDVHDELCRIDVTKSSGPDEIPGRLLKEGAERLAGPLSQLFNKSMTLGILPGQLQT